MESIVLEYPMGEVQNAVDNIIDVSSSYPCTICKKSFSSTNNLYRHQRSIHKVQPKIRCTLRCPEKKCQYTSSWHAELRTHLKSTHGMHLEEIKLTFPSMNEFSKWREEEERSSKSMFIARTSMKKLRDGSSRMYLSCHRSGIYKSKSRGKRQLKLKGSCKINRCCPATMKIENKPGAVFVHYFKTHCGHSSDVGDMTHLRLRETERALIAGKLAQGVSFEHLLDDLQSSNIKPFNRFHLLTKKDLYNIQRNFNLRHKTAAKERETLEDWLEKSLAQGDQSPVLYCKNRGSSYEDYNTMEGGLEVDDFLLVLSNPLQRDMLLQFGSNIVCIDCVDASTSQELALTTVVVFDEFQEPFPVAFCLSNKMDFVIFRRFFDTLRERVGNVRSSILMTDDLPALYGAWGQVMGEYEHHLLCPWYTEKCWKNLIEKIPKAKKPKRLTVSRCLKALLEMDEIEKFSEDMSLFLEEMAQDEDTAAFTLLFKHQFALRPEMWAHCYLGPKWATVAAHLDTMHRALRNAFCQGKDLEHIVRCITSLCKLVRDRNCNRLAKAIDHEEDVHAQADNTGIVLEVVEEGHLWRLQNSCEETVEVQKIAKHCTIQNCDSSTCTHVYVCSCFGDFAFPKSCQHVEMVVQLLQCQPPVLPATSEHLPTENTNNKPDSDRVEEKVETLLGFLKKRKFSCVDLDQMEKQIDKWLSCAQSGSGVPTQTANDTKLENSEVLVNSNGNSGDNNIILFICPPPVNAKVPISRYKSPLDKAGNKNSGTVRSGVHSGFDHVY